MTTWRELSFPVESQGAAGLVIEDDRAKVVLDPLRWRILEILDAGKSVMEISEALDVTDARVLYHVQRLAQTEVVHLEGDAGSDPRQWRCLPAAAVISVQEEQEAAGSSGQEAIPAAVAGQFNQAFREVAEGCSDRPSRCPSTTTARGCQKPRPPNSTAGCWRSSKNTSLPARETGRASSTVSTACSRRSIFIRSGIPTLVNSIDSSTTVIADLDQLFAVFAFAR